MSIRWITSQLGTAPALQFEVADDMNVIDVRDLIVDKSGNHVEAVRQKIVAGQESLRSGKRTVVCCDYGISRSNAIAAGILAKHESLPFGTAALFASCRPPAKRKSSSARWKWFDWHWRRKPARLRGAPNVSS